MIGFGVVWVWVQGPGSGVWGLGFGLRSSVFGLRCFGVWGLGVVWLVGSVGGSVVWLVRLLRLVLSRVARFL